MGFCLNNLTNTFKWSLLVLVLSLMVPDHKAFAQEEENQEAVEQESDIEMDPLLINLYRGQVNEGILIIRYHIGMADDGNYGDVNAMVPKIIATLYTDVTRLARLRFRADEPVNIKLLDVFMQRSLDKVVGKDKAEIFIDAAVVQRGSL